MAKILLVEDDKSLREIYGVRLMAEGYTITSAGDGEEALAVAIKERPDLIVSDVMMPKISGFDMLDILRSTTETKDIKVIMMTALSSEDQRARGESLGADRYLVKSQVGIEDVVRTVHDVLGDGLPGANLAPAAAPVVAAVPAAPAPAPAAPVAPLDPTPAPVAAAPLDIPAPLPVAPVPVEPIAPTPFVAPVTAEPTIPAAPSAPTIDVPAPTPAVVIPDVIAAPAPAPVFTPAPEAAPAPVAPVVIPEPVAAPAPVPAPVTLPEPTAPFSSNGPASLGDRIINPLPSADGLANNGMTDIAAQMNQELNAHLQDLQTSAPAAPAVPTIPVDPVPAPQVAPAPQPLQQPPLPPLPPQPGI